MTTPILTRRPLDLSSLRLGTGNHKPPADGSPPSARQACINEAVAWMAGEPWSDSPKCASPVLRAFAMRLTARWDDEARDRLAPFAELMIGTAGDGQDRARGLLAVDWLIRTYTPRWLDLAGLTAEAQELRELRRIVDLATAKAARPLVMSAREAAWTKRAERRREFEEKFRAADAADAAGAAELKGKTPDQSLGERLWERDDTPVMVIAELGVTRLEKSPDRLQKDRIVRIGLSSCEVAFGDSEHLLRSAQKALFMQRTAVGTITEDGDVRYCEAILASLGGGHLDASEAVRLRITLDWLHEQLKGLARKVGLDATGLRRETKQLAAIAGRALAGEQLSLDDAIKAKAALTAAEAQIAAEEAQELAAAKGRLDETTESPDGQSE